MRTSLAVASLFAIISLATPSPDDPATTSAAPVPQPTICGDIVNSGDIVFLASDAYECLTSVPFNPAVATRFLQYYNDTLQFQTTPAYLKNPPASYQQPSIDLFEKLDQLQRDVDKGIFPNQYAFEAVLQNIIYSAHDGHLQLIAGVLAAFTFASPYDIVSVSRDGKELPKVYITPDLRENPGNDSRWTPSAISLINGRNAADYLAQFAALNAVGGLEPHADWNQLMSSPVLEIQGYTGVFDGFVTFYPGENITFTFENGTVLGPAPWLAFYNSPGDVGPLATGGDFYNYFVLGLYPASFNFNGNTAGSGSAQSSSAPSATTSAGDASSISTPTATPTPSGWNNDGYPQIADIIQQDLGSGGVVTGYFLHDVSLGVLSIPSFEAYGDSVGQFSNTVANFLQRSKDAGLKKILLDLQQNSGGDTLLALDTFKQFFPTTEPFAGSRLRASVDADILGNTFTTYYDTQTLDPLAYSAFSASDWVATDLLVAETGENFTSWGEFFGPSIHNGDQFTITQRYNLSSDVFDKEASGGITVYGHGNRPATAPQPYAAEDIAILSDALCSSACALFMEAMQHDNGVRSVVVGGQPKNGPMQAPSGTRGAEYYSAYDLDADFQVATTINASTGALLSSRVEDVLISYLGINIKDQIRRDEDIPLQFLYLAADCRVFFRLDNFWNMTNLWKYAAAAIFTNPEYCVTNSIGRYYASSANNTSEPSTSATPTPSPNINTNISHNIACIIDLSSSKNALPASFSGQQSDTVTPKSTKIGQTCKDDTGCPGGGFKCISVSGCGSPATERCVKTCTTSSRSCGGLNCITTHKDPPKFKNFTPNVQEGYCPLPSNCLVSVTGPDRYSPTTVPSPKLGSSGGGRSGGTRDEWLVGGSLGSIVKAGLASWK